MSNNIFWVGGTGANVAMSFARLQFLAMFPYAEGVQHFFIDCPENLSDSRGHIQNIGIKEFESLVRHWPEINLQWEKISLTDNKLNSFDDFLNVNTDLRLLFSGFPDYDEMLKTPIKDGNYYRPAIAAALAAIKGITENYDLTALGNGDYSIICASSYGGTGAGVTPALVRHLLERNHRIDVVYLNRWIIDKRNRNINIVTESNENANIVYLKRLLDNTDNANVDLYLYRVTDEWQQNVPEEKNNNTTFEIENPFPYYIAFQICNLLSTASGELKSGGTFHLSIDRTKIWQNPFFIHSYAYSRLFNYADKDMPVSFNFILNLMEDKLYGRQLRRLGWDKDVFENTRTIEYGNSSEASHAREQIRNAFQSKSRGTSNNDWLGFRVVNSPEIRLSANIDIPISYPTIFASYFEFTSKLPDSNVYKEAYLSLVSLILTKRVYAEYDDMLNRHAYTDETGGMPFSLRNSTGIVGFTATAGLYVWPILDRIDELRQMLASDEMLQSSLHRLHTLNQTERLWSVGSYLDMAMNWWKGVNDNDQVVSVLFNAEFFREVVYTNTSTKVPNMIEPEKCEFIENALHIDIDINKTGNIASFILPCEKFNLFITNDKILQYVNVVNGNHERRSDKIFLRPKNCESILILNYRTALELKDIDYKVEIMHPSYLLGDRTFAFKLHDGTLLIPWPIRKEFVNCIHPDNGWSNNTSVNYPTLIDGKFVDMGNHTIRNWGKPYSIDKSTERLFKVRVGTSTDDSGSEDSELEAISYQGYVWPQSAKEQRFVESWRFYSVMITCQPTNITLGSKVATNRGFVKENWHYMNSGNWVPIEPYGEAGTYVASYEGSAPEAISLEIDTDTILHTAYFPIPNSVPGEGIGQNARVGLDFGTLNSCLSVRLPNSRITQVRLNPSELLYQVFASFKWEDIPSLDFSWIPHFRPNRNIIIPTGLFVPDESQFKNIKCNFDVQTEVFSYIPRDAENRLLPLQHYSIPGDTLDENIRQNPRFCIYNIKWSGNNDDKYKYWRSFLTTYLLLVAAQLKLGTQFSIEVGNIQIYATVPLRFRVLHDDITNIGDQLTLEEIYASILNNSTEYVSHKTSANIEYRGLSYEAVSSLPDRIRTDSDRFSIVVDVGGGTTDVAVFRGNTCISASSFVFGGNNPFREAYKSDYINRQLAIRDGDNPLEGKDNITEAFIHLLAAYTALLIGAVIKRMEIKDLEALKIYLLGQAWHLAKFHPSLSGRPNAEKLYVDQVVKDKILTMFNTYICTEIFNNSTHRLTRESLELLNNPQASKISCSEGALRPVPTPVSDDSINLPSFFGISYGAVNKEVTCWYQNEQNTGIDNASQIIINKDTSISPILIIKEEGLRQIFKQDKYNRFDIEQDPFSNGIILRNVVEYLIEREIGQYDPSEIEKMKMNHSLVNIDLSRN